MKPTSSGGTRVFRILAVAAVLAAGAITPAASAAAKPVRLTGTVVLSGSNSAYLDVTVPRTARLGDPLFPERRNSVRVSGGGRAVGFALVPKNKSEAVSTIGARFRFTDDLGATPGYPLIVGGTTDPSSGFDRVVPAGQYRLYLLTDGRPATVTLRFTGLTGQLRLHPKAKAKMVLQGQTPQLDARPGSTTAYIAGDDFRSSRPVLSFDTFAMRHDIHTESVWTACFHTTEPAGPAPYGPGCPSTAGSQSAAFPIVVSDENVDQANQVRAFWAGGEVRAGHVGMGGNLVTTTPAEAAGYEQLWLEL